jgi:hypothetical protein
MMKTLPLIVILSLAPLFSGCEAKEAMVHTGVATQDMVPQTGETEGPDTPGLEGMSEDDQGIIYF